jgi:hypothetical protein
MPRSVIVLSSDPNLFENVRATFRSDTRFIDAVDTLHCDGSVSPLTNIYPVEMNSVEWDDWDSDASVMPDPRIMSVLIFECRSPEWIAEVGRLLANGLDTPVRIVDASNTAWPANQINPAAIVLT